MVGNRCYHRVISSPPPSIVEIHSLDTQILAWKETVPSWLQPNERSACPYQWLHFSAQKLFWRCCNLRIILHRRAFLERALKGLPLTTAEATFNSGNPTAGVTDNELELRSSEQCLENASQTIRSIHQFFVQPPRDRLEAWYGL